MIGKKSVGNLVGAWYAAIYGALIMMVIYAYWPSMSIAVFLLLSSAVCIAVYWAGRWIQARKELNKKLPMSSKELRRRKKEFYERLDSQGRSQSSPRSRSQH
jgi:cytochrome c biogenesis protein ResB